MPRWRTYKIKLDPEDQAYADVINRRIAQIKAKRDKEEADAYAGDVAVARKLKAIEARKKKEEEERKKEEEERKKEEEELIKKAAEKQQDENYKYDYEYELLCQIKLT